MDAIEAIRKRRSVRRYTDRPVADADVDELLRLALLAPTGEHGAGLDASWWCASPSGPGPSASW